MNHDSLPPLPSGIDRVLLILRWLVLALAIALSFIDRSTEGVFVGIFPLAGSIAVYNLSIQSSTELGSNAGRLAVHTSDIQVKGAVATTAAIPSLRR
jgi:hypothetical protein